MVFQTISLLTKSLNILIQSFFKELFLVFAVPSISHHQFSRKSVASLKPKSVPHRISIFLLYVTMRLPHVKGRYILYPTVEKTTSGGGGFVLLDWGNKPICLNSLHKRFK